MILVKTKLAKSSVHGIGLFADQFIPKGAVTWQYHSKFDSAFSQQEVNEMSEPARKQFLIYAFYYKKINAYVLCFDDQRFINHSYDLSKINIHTTPERDVAARDIQPGEELFCDYNNFDDSYFPRHNIKAEDLI